MTLVFELNDRLRKQWQIHSERACDGCTLCCTLMPVDEMAKPAGEPCPHACTGKGCGIYDQRPDECRGFACEWILDARMPGDLKPDRCGFVVTVTPDRRVMNIIPSRTLTQGQWRRLVRLAEQVGEHSIVMVLVRDLAEGHQTYRQFISRKPKCAVSYMPDDAGRPFTIFFFSKELYGRLARLAPKDQLAALLSMGMESSKDLFKLGQARAKELKRAGNA